MSVRRKNAVVCASSLLLGGVLYILLRPETFIAKSAYRLLPCLQRYALSNKGRFPFVCYYFLDFLWGLSLGCGLTVLFSPEIKGVIRCGAVAFLCGVVWEVFQLLRVAGGTADWLDIMMYLTAWGIAVVINMIGVDTNEKMD